MLGARRRQVPLDGRTGRRDERRRRGLPPLGSATAGGWAAIERRVVGIVENPQSLLDEFALVVPGQVKAPTQVVALFDAPGVPLGSIGAAVETPASVAQANPLNPETISLAALVLGMLLVALVSVGGFTVLAQRRLRSIGMLESIGATDRHVRLVVRANGVVVGLVGAAGRIRARPGGLARLPAEPRAERPPRDRGPRPAVGRWSAAAMVLAVVAAYFAASRPARAITQVPIVVALSGRPAPPRQVRRSAIPGIVCFVHRLPPARLLGQHRPRERERRRARARASGSCSSSPGSSCWRRSSSRSRRGSAGAPPSRPGWRCATSPATEPGRARRWRRSASASWSR